MNAFELQWSHLYAVMNQLAVIFLFSLVYAPLEILSLTDT